MANPGYVMVDFTGVDVNSNSSVTISGITKRINDALASGKPCYACNLVDDTIPLSPMPVTVYKDRLMNVMLYGHFNLAVGPLDDVSIIR